MKAIVPFESQMWQPAWAALAAVAILGAIPEATHAAVPSVRALHRGTWDPGPGGHVRDVKVVGNYAYLALGMAGFAVVDVSDPANCVRVGGVEGIGNAMAVAISGDRAYVVGQKGTDPLWGLPVGILEVINVRDPSNPLGSVSISIGGMNMGVTVSGNYAYIAGNGGLGLSIVGLLLIVDTTNGRLVGYVTTGGHAALGVAVSGNHAYVVDDRMVVFDVSDPANPVWLAYADSGSHGGIAVSGNYAYTSRGYDVTDPSNPVLIESFRPYGDVRSVVVSGNYAYVAAGDAGLQVIDVSNPTNCVLVGTYNTRGTAEGVALSDGRIYIANGEAGLLVLPTLPNVQYTVRVVATPGVPFTLEAATDLSAPFPWTPLLTTNVPAMPFDFVDYDVKLSDKPQKFYRVRQQ